MLSLLRLIRLSGPIINNANRQPPHQLWQYRQLLPIASNPSLSSTFSHHIGFTIHRNIVTSSKCYQFENNREELVNIKKIPKFFM